MTSRPLAELAKNKKPVKEVVGGLLASSKADSIAAGQTLLSAAKDYGLGLKDYLDLAIEHDREAGLTGFELALAELNLPFRNDFASGIVLEAASDTFQTHAGTRALFPEVIDSMLQWANRQTQFERTEDFVALSRTISGVVLLSTVVNDDSADRDTFTVAEGGRFPVQAIRTSDKSVTFHKHGSALRFTYEFNRRAALDLITPYAARIARQLSTSKVSSAVNVLVNGDGVAAAAVEVNQSAYNTPTGVTATAGSISWDHYLYWLVQRAKAGTPVDTVVGNWDSAFKWMQLFSKPTANAGSTSVEQMAKALGVDPKAVSNFSQMNIPMPTFVVASAAPAAKLIGLTKADAIEELKEAGSDISENERAILNQTITYVKSETTGYRIIWGDAREVFDYGN